MTDRLLDWLAARSGRERVLIALCLFVALPICLVFTVLLPLSESHAAALDARDEARGLEAWVQNRAELASNVAIAETVIRPDPIGSTGLEAALVDAGLWSDVSDLGVQEGGVIELTFDTVVFTRLADWVSRQAPDWGYDIGSFRIEAQDDPGRVSARFVLRPQN